MKIARIEYKGRVADAVVDSDQVRVIGTWQSGDPLEMPFLPPARPLTELWQRAEAATEILPLADVRLLPPIGPLSKLICLGLNYREHVDEVAADMPPQPGFFTKFPDALVGHDAPLERPKLSAAFDFEGEIAVVIGKAGRHIAPEQALDHVFGYAIMMDGSLRDYQGHSVSAGKNFWHSGALGPWIVTAEEIPDPAVLELTTRLNGEVVQASPASLMIYDILTSIAYLSRLTPLAPGDVIATGTPGGVGARRTPPLWMKHGDRIAVEVSGVGTLSNPIEDER